MTGCGLIGFDLIACGTGAFWSAFWWVADLIPWWGWLAALVAAGWLIWRAAGVPGIVAFAAGIGWLFGRRSGRSKPVSTEEQYDPHKPAPRRTPIPRKPGEPANDWFKRVTGQD